MQHTPVHDAPRERAHQFGMRDATEVVREVGVDDFRMLIEQRLFHLGHRLLGIAAPPIGVLLGRKVSFEDRVQHQHRCCHAHPVTQSRDAQRPQVAVGFRDIHSSDRIRSVPLLPERKRQFTEPPLDPVLLDIRKVLAVYTRRPLVGAALGVGMRQDVLAVDLVVQGVEAVPGFRLRFRV
jgi:hypothetical protein